LIAEKEIAVVESVKAAADVYAPIAGTVTEVNQALLTHRNRSIRTPTLPGCSR
jgi:glycine cleavage system H lipoate-binding protein